MTELIRHRMTGKTIELSTTDVGPGPYHVVIAGSPNPGYWWLFNTQTHTFRRIGKVGAEKTNYYDVAQAKARELNATYMLKKAGGL